MNIAHVIMLPNLEGFGSGHYLKGLCKATSSYFNNTIITGAHARGDNIYNVRSLYKPLPWIYWGDSPALTMKWLYEFTDKLESVIKKTKINIINVHHTGYPLLPAILCKKRFNIPIVLTIHGSCFMEIRETSDKLCQSANVGMFFQNFVKEADALVVLSESQRYKVAQIFKHSDITLITPGIDECFIKNPLSLPDKNKTYFFYAGRISSCKGIADLLDIFNDSSYQLVLAGPTQDIDLTKLNKNNISYLGNIKQTELHKYYSGAIATLIPSIWDEPFGLVATESLACGSPVVAYDSGALKEIINNTNGILCNTKEELKSAVQRIATGSITFDRKALALEARLKYSWKLAGQKYLTIYERVSKYV